MSESGGVSMALRYIPLALAAQWEDNPKKHDTFRLIESMQRYGFQDPPRFMQALNDGRGGLARGNGRTHALQTMKVRGMAPPAGIGYIVNDAEYNGEWAVPVVFGVDIADENEAAAYALDNNNLVLAGGDYTPFFVAQMYDADAYTEMVRDLLAQDVQPVTVNEAELTAVADAILTSTGHKDRPAATTARVRLGEFIIKVPLDAFEAWFAGYSAEHDGDKEALIAATKARLGLLPYYTPQAMTAETDEQDGGEGDDNA